MNPVAVEEAGPKPFWSLGHDANAVPLGCTNSTVVLSESSHVDSLNVTLYVVAFASILTVAPPSPLPALAAVPGTTAMANAAAT
jgi:hypothetical protein